jgi:hypothetical protein
MGQDDKILKIIVFTNLMRYLEIFFPLLIFYTFLLRRERFQFFYVGK